MYAHYPRRVQTEFVVDSLTECGLANATFKLSNIVCEANVQIIRISECWIFERWRDYKAILGFCGLESPGVECRRR